jgi:acyl-CoA synthetase (AMP-forming)/AMP-acid ligase II
MSELATVELSPDPILGAFEEYRGSIFDIDRGVECSADVLRANRDRLSDRARDGGLRCGDRVILSVGNGPAFVTALTAILDAGGSPLLLHADTPPAESKRFACSFGARFILCESHGPAAMQPVCPAAAEFALDGFPALTWADVDDTDETFDHDYPELPPAPLHPTSGTTGRPKVAVRPGQAALAEARNYRQALDVTGDDCLLCVVPMSHAYGFGTCVMLPLVSGARVVSTRRFNPRIVQRALQVQGISIFPAVPAMLDLLMASTSAGALPAPRHLLSAGAPLSERTARRVFENTGIVVSPLYGTTETGGISVAAGDPQPCLGTCVGRSMRAVSVAVRPVADAPELSQGIGRVCVQSPSLMAGYLSHDGIDESSIVDGWFETGDLGFLDSERRIHLVAREKEVINVFGMKVIPGEVEAVIAAFPQVTDVKVYAGTHRSGSQIVKAAVAGPESFDVAALKEHCQRHLAPYKRPEIITRLDALPRSPTGKIIRDRLP